MYELYYSPGACSRAVHFALQALAVPFKAHCTVISKGQTRTPEFLKLNPRGQVPLLVEDGRPILEGAAQMLYLFDKHGPSPYFPAVNAPTRAHALEWLMFGNATLHPLYSRYFSVSRIFPDDKAAAETMGAAVLANIQTAWDGVEAVLAKSAFVCGEHLTLPDVLLTVIAGWVDKVQFGPNTQRMIAAVKADKHFAAVVDTETKASQAQAA